MRHVLGVLGVLAAAVLLAVSAAMNWRFGYSLGKTELDGIIYGSASAAADCFKALVPFFFFAAIRNRMWSQAVASALVWVVVLAYSLTSALGHAALNRLDTAGQRAAHAQSYQDLRADLKRAEEQLGWIPQHRPAQTVQAEIESLKMQRAWKWSSECTDIKGAQTRGLCQKYQGLTSELASAEQADALGKRIDEVQAKLANTSGHGNAVMSEGDPQAAVLSKLVSFVGMGNVKVEDMQTALTIFVALLLEVGSGFGMYVAFSTWRLHEPKVLEVAAYESTALASAPPAPAPVVAPHVALAAPAAVAIANDNSDKDISLPKLSPPDNDVERYIKERTECTGEKSILAKDLYDDYTSWCQELNKANLAYSVFFKYLKESGVQRVEADGKKRYVISLRATSLHQPVSEDEKRATVNEPAPAAQAA
ncbi:MAG: hypothetical protein AB7E81_00375 [Hyphomicrobiaceae bacterium]